MRLPTFAPETRDMMRNILFRSARVAETILLLLMTAAACTRFDIPEKETATEEGPRQVRFSVSGDDFLHSRSVLSPSVENRITSVSLLFYRNGKLETTTSFPEASGEVIFMDNVERTVYALVNMDPAGEMAVPNLEENLEKLTWRLTSYGDMERDGLPMAGAAAFRPSDKTCTITVRRLVSRFDFSLSEEYMSFFGASERLADEYWDPSVLFKNMTYTLKNINGALRPFGESVAGPGDLLDDSEFDLTPDGNAVLYVPENLQGDLLDTWDPSKKTLEALQDRYGAGQVPGASYVEVSFFHDPSVYGVGGDLTYRFFLGENNTNNFSVGRNRLYKVFFGPEYDTVMGCHDMSKWTWKVESKNWGDSRYLYMANDYYNVEQGGTVEIPVVYGYEGVHHPEYGDTCDPYATYCDWRAYVRLDYQSDDALVPCYAYDGFSSVSYDPTGGRLRISASRSAPVGTSLRLVLKTWDGRHEDSATLYIVPHGYM